MKQLIVSQKKYTTNSQLIHKNRICTMIFLSALFFLVPDGTVFAIATQILKNEFAFKTILFLTKYFH